MIAVQVGDIDRLNAEIVGHLLAQRSPPRELIAQRESLRAAIQGRGAPVQGETRRRSFGFKD